MAKQTGMYMVGRRAHLIYYQWKGGYYLRTKSSLTAKRVLEDPAFARSRVRAQEFGVASRLATEIFRLLPHEARKRGVIGRLTGAAHTGLMAGNSPALVREVLLELVEQLIPRSVVRKYRRLLGGEKSPGLLRQQLWIGENKQASSFLITPTSMLNEALIKEELQQLPVINSAIPPDG